MIGGAFASVFVAATIISEQTITHGPAICPLKIATGLDCPFCGMTRAFVFAAHGDLSAASGFNPGWPLAAVMVIVAVILCWRDASAGSDLAGRLWRGILARGWLIFAALSLLTLVRWAWPKAAG